MITLPRGPLMIGISAHTLSDEDRERLLHPNVGGVILFSRNFQSTTQLMALTKAINALRAPKLLIAVDHEGGRVQRFKDGFASLAAIRTFGETYDHDQGAAQKQAAEAGELMAMELKSCGVDMSFAPVLDIDDGQSEILATRGFHHEPAIIAQLAKAYRQGMQRANMAAVGKHFPGHGSVKFDTHLQEVMDNRPLETILSEDLVPFARLIKDGLESVMTAHVIYTQVDSLPASFSPIWLKQILRDQLGFSGIVFSDDLGMAAASAFGDAWRSTQAAVDAGCDMILLCNDFEQMDQVILNLAPKNYSDLSRRLSVFTQPMKYDKLVFKQRLDQLLANTSGAY